MPPQPGRPTSVRSSVGLAYSPDFRSLFIAEGWEDRWTVSEAKGDLGKFVASEDGGIKTSEDAKFYGIATSFDKFSNTGKDLVVQVRNFFELSSKRLAGWDGM